MSLALPLFLALAADPASIEMTGSCEDASLEQRVGHYLRDSQATSDGWRARGVLTEQSDGTWQIQLEIVAPDSTESSRAFTSERCGVAVDAAAFVFASAIDPTLPPPVVEPEPEPAPQPILEPPPKAEPQRSTEDPPPPRTAAGEVVPQRPIARPPLRAALRAGAGVMGGALPGVGASFGLLAALLGQAWRAELLAMARLPTDKESSRVPEAGGTLGLWIVGGRGCGVPSVRRLSFPLCTGLEAGQVFARGTGFEDRQRTRVPWGAATFAPGIAFAPIERLALVAEAQVGVSFNRAELVIEGLETLHTVGPAFGRGFIGLEVRLP